MWSLISSTWPSSSNIWKKNSRWHVRPDRENLHYNSWAQCLSLFRYRSYSQRWFAVECLVLRWNALVDWTSIQVNACWRGRAMNEPVFVRSTLKNLFLLTTSQQVLVASVDSNQNQLQLTAYSKQTGEQSFTSSSPWSLNAKDSRR